MQGGVTILPPRTRETKPTATEKVGHYFDCDAVPTGAVTASDRVYASFGNGQVGGVPPIKRCSGAAISHLVVTPEPGWMLTAADDVLVLWPPLGRTAC